MDEHSEGPGLVSEQPSLESGSALYQGPNSRPYMTRFPDISPLDAWVVYSEQFKPTFALTCFIYPRMNILKLHVC